MASDTAQPTLAWLFERAGDPLGWVDLSGQVTAVNDAWRRLLGSPPLPILLSSIGPEVSLPNLSGLDAGGAASAGQLRSGAVTWDLALARADDGRLLVHAVQRDPAALRDHFQIIERFPAAIAIHRGGQLVYANHKTVELLGHDSVAALLGSSIRDLIHESEIEPVTERIAHMARTGEPVPDRETRLVRRDGSIALAELSAFSVPMPDGDIFVVVARDVTERRKLEAQLRHGRRMEAIGRLAGGIAHDFNNHLSVILNCAEFLTESLPHETAARRDAEEIHHAAQRASGLTKQLLMFSRGDMAEPELVDVNEVVTRLSEFLRRLIGANVELTTRLGHGLPMIRAVSQHLEQILVNLAVNARDATPSGGEVRIETSTARYATDRAPGPPDVAPGRYVVIEVHDNGEGMSAEVASRAFEPFFTTKDPGKGTGLGLSTVYGIVSQVGGLVSIDTSQGRGTSVRILWPAVEGQHEEDRHHRLADAPPSELVLLVEDDAAVRTMVSRMLKRLGFDVIEAIDALEAVQLMEDGPLDLDVVVTDVVMPRMTGPELVMVLHETEPDLPVVFMSGYADEVLEEHDLRPGHVTFLPKPFTSKELKDKIEQARTRASRSL